MFRRHSFFPRILFALLILGGFAMTTMIAYRAGAAHEHVLGVTTTDAESDDLEPETRHLFPLPHMARHIATPHFPCLGPFFCGGVLFLIVLAALCHSPFWHHPPMMRPHHPRWFSHRRRWHMSQESPTDEGSKSEEKTDKVTDR
ncbi:MAG: hypothetical protein JXB07_12565 [Anaerolineae bacterium]|nr:hypothetical protein [Anaerolineae bacterium]